MTMLASGTAGHRTSDSPLIRDRMRWSVRVRPTRLIGSSTNQHRRYSGDITASSGLPLPVRLREGIRRQRVDPEVRVNSEMNHNDQHAFREYHSSMTDRHATVVNGGRLSRDNDAWNRGDTLSNRLTKRSESFRSETRSKPSCNQHQRRPQVLSISVCSAHLIMLKRSRAKGGLSVCLSVRLFVCHSSRYLVASSAIGHWGTCPPSTSNNFIFCSLWSKSESQLSKYCVVCEIS